jgi:hypothetical protein
MSASQVRAGQAFVEIVARDKLGAGLSRAMGKLKAFAAAVKATKAADMFRDMGRTLTGIGAAMAAAGGGIVAVMASAVGKFMEVSKHAKSIGVAIAGIDPSKFERLNAAFNTAKAVLGAIQFFVGAALAEPLTRILHVLISVGLEIAKFIKNNQQLVVTVAAVGAGLLVAGAALMGLGAVFGIIGASIAAVVAGLAALATPTGMVLGLFLGLAAAIFGGVAAGFAFTDAGQNAVGGIAAAIANGDIQGAFAIVLQSLATMWAQWSEFAVSLFTGAATAIVNVWSGMVKALTNMILDLASQYGTVMSVITGGINVEDEIRKSGAFDRARGIATQDVLGDAKKGGANHVDSMTGPLRDFIDAMKEAAANSRKAAEGTLKDISDEQKGRFAARIKGVEAFSAQIGAEQGLGSSVGQFGGAAAGQLGVGPQSRMEQKQDETNNLLKRVIEVIKGLEVGVEVG